MWTLARMQVATSSKLTFFDMVVSLSMWTCHLCIQNKISSKKSPVISSSETDFGQSSSKFAFSHHLRVHFQQKVHIRDQLGKVHTLHNKFLQKVHVDTCTRASGHFIQTDIFWHDCIPQHVDISVVHLEQNFIKEITSYIKF